MKTISDFLNKIINSDCVEIMKSIPNSCIDLTITSPPYDNLRAYNEYSFNFEDIAKQLYRITKNGGVVVWVVSDQTINGSETGTSFRQALYFKSIGFNLHDTMIYKSEKPPSLSNRYYQKFEYMFVFSKLSPKTFNPITAECIYKGQTHSHRSFRQFNGDLTNSNNTKIKDTKIIGNIWEYGAGYCKSSLDKIAFEHPAIFPEQLAKDHILSWSNVGDIVLDPMCGSGTTCKIAKLSGRNYIGIDISKEYCEIAEKRLLDIPQYETETDIDKQMDLFL